MSNNDLGQKGESLAESYLERQGHKIVDKNFRYKRFGEIDIISLKNGVLHFNEIKTRQTNIFGEPYEAVNFRKIEKIKKLALIYTSRATVAFVNWQINTISVRFTNTDEYKVEFFENITLG